MSNAVPRRSAKPVSIHKPNTGRAKILKFDRRAGVVVEEKTPSVSKSISLVELVRNLLSFLTPSGMAPRSPNRKRALRLRKRR